MFVVEFVPGNYALGTITKNEATASTITQVIDSSSSNPDPGTPIALEMYLQNPDLKCEKKTVQVSDGFLVTGGATISFEGFSNNFWQITESDPSLLSTTWKQSINVDVYSVGVSGKTTTKFWIRGLADPEEDSKNDTQPKMKIEGKVEAV